MAQQRFDIKIDLSTSQDQQVLQSLASLTPLVVQAVTEAVFQQWNIVAGRELHASRQRYQQAIKVRNVSPVENIIYLDGWFANMIEFGRSAYDMKPFFAQSRKVKITKRGGWYVVIPFRIGTPGTLTPENFSAVMTPEIYALAKALAPQRTNIAGVRQIGQSLRAENLPASEQTPRTRAAFSDPRTQQTFQEYQHRSPIFAGIRRSEMQYQNSVQSQYNTFRVISSNSDPMSWINRGIAEYNLGGKALAEANINDVMDNAINAFFNP